MQWLEDGKEAVLAVPSVVVPAETNYVLNRAHPDFGLIEIGKPETFDFDPRMWKAPRS